MPLVRGFACRVRGWLLRAGGGTVRHLQLAAHFYIVFSEIIVLQMPKIDTSNRFMVSGARVGLTLLNPPRPRDLITPDEALVLAAYLVSMAEHLSEFTFEQVMDAVMEG